MSYEDNNIRDTEWFKQNFVYRGWKQIEEIMDQTSDMKQLAVVLALAKLGCRAGELSSLLRKNVWIDERHKSLICSGMLVEKHKQKMLLADLNNKPIIIDGEKQWEVVPKKDYRQFAIPLKERFNKLFLELVNEQKDPDRPVFNFNRWQCYYHLSLIGAVEKGLVHKRDWWKPEFRSEWFPHWFRHWRATDLCSSYSNFRNPIVLQDWFLWRDPKMPNYYIKMSMSAQYVDPKEVR